MYKILAKILKLLFCAAVASLPLYAGFAVRSYEELRNQDVIRQNYEESCGAASLATLINTIDFKILTEKDVLEQMDKGDKKTNTDMVSFLQLKQAADKLSYDSEGYQLDRATFEKINLPVLVKIEDDPRFPHFVVVINHQGDFITILDPSYGKYISSKDQFYNIWDKHKQGGYVLILGPKNDIHREYKLDLPIDNKALFDKL